MNFDPAAEIRRLRDIIEEKDEEIRQLRAAGKARFAFPSRFGLTATEARIVSRLLSASPGVLALESLRMLCLTGEEVRDKTIHVHVGRVRRKLSPSGVVIRCCYGEGYSMERDSAERLRELIL